jgi:hypothetical protein
MTQLQTTVPQSLSRKTTFLFAGLILFLFLLTLLLYTVAHDGGHALVGMALGGRITAFDVNFFDLGAHAGVDGSFTLAQRALIAVAGISLPILLLVLFILATPRKANTVLEWFRLCAFLGTSGSLLAWIAIPWLVQAGQTVSDDSVGFMGYTRFPAALVSGAALAVYLAVWAVFLGRLGGFRDLVARFRAIPDDLNLPPARKTFASLAALGVLVGVISLALPALLPDPLSTAPAGYQLQATADLSARGYADESVYQLALEKPANLSLFIILKDVKSAPVKVHLTGPDGYDETFLGVAAGEPFDAGHATVNPHEMSLAPGSYDLRITFQQCRGMVKVYSLIDSNE